MNYPALQSKVSNATQLAIDTILSFTVPVIALTVSFTIATGSKPVVSIATILLGGVLLGTGTTWLLGADPIQRVARRLAPFYFATIGLPIVAGVTYRFLSWKIGEGLVVGATLYSIYWSLKEFGWWEKTRSMYSEVT